MCFVVSSKYTLFSMYMSPFPYFACLQLFNLMYTGHVSNMEICWCFPPIFTPCSVWKWSWPVHTYLKHHVFWQPPISRFKICFTTRTFFYLIIAVYIDSLVMISIERSETNKKRALEIQDKIF